MAIFSIKDIEAVSGIKCHTLRIWEQRYGILCPKRTETNIRYYDDDDLKYIINISILNREGYKISEIARMDKEEIHKAILKYCGCNAEQDNILKSLVSAMLSFDEYRLHNLITTAFIQMGVEQAMIRVVFPFLNEIGILWQIGSIKPCHEHFASGIITQKLFVAIDGQVGRYHDQRKKFLLFLPEGEQHSISLLFANYVLRSRGQDVLYLGQEVPLVDLKEACLGQEPDYIFTVLISARVQEEKQELINGIASGWPGSKVLLSGTQFMNCDLQYPDNVRMFRKIEDFMQFVEALPANNRN